VRACVRVHVCACVWERERCWWSWNAGAKSSTWPLLPTCDVM